MLKGLLVDSPLSMQSTTLIHRERPSVFSFTTEYGWSFLSFYIIMTPKCFFVLKPTRLYVLYGDVTSTSLLGLFGLRLGHGRLLVHAVP